MGGLSSRQVVVLSVANYQRLCDDLGTRAGEEAFAALRACVLSNDVPALHMRKLRDHILLVRLDELAHKEFLLAVRNFAKSTRRLSLPSYPDVRPQVLVGAINERAQRANVDAMALGLLAYLRRTGEDVAFLTGDDRDLWGDPEAQGMSLLSYEQLQGMDPATGMLRPDYFVSLLQQALDDPRLLNEGCSVLYFDIEDFKSYNRAFGRRAGDNLLLLVAQSIYQEFPADIMCHVAIDRYVVATSARNVESRIERIHAQIRAVSEAFAPEIKCGVFTPVHGTLDAGAAMDCAKLACERAKGVYDVAFRHFDQQMEQQVFFNQYVAHSANAAITQAWIKAFYQPVVCAATGELCGYEALCRWDDPKRGLLSPVLFIPPLEDAHLIHKVDAFMVNEACRSLAAFMQAGKPVVPVSVNLSRLDFTLCDMVSVVEEACERWGVPHELIAVEVTESVLDANQTKFLAQMDRFRAAGFEVWMDDFGSGYSSLNLLKDYEFDVLKVDMEFLRGMGDDARSGRSRTIVAAVLRMARELGIKTLVEGVETKAQRDFLREAGCDMMQGYLFGRPQPINPPTPTESRV